MQIAFALPLLVGASLLIQSAIEVARVDLGFRPERVATLAFEVSRSKHASDQAGRRLLRAIGRRRAGRARRRERGHRESHSARRRADQSRCTSRTRPGTTDELTERRLANGDARILRDARHSRSSRAATFTEHDDATSPVVAIVDERVARTIWPGETAIGKRFRGPDGAVVRTIVIGVVGACAHRRAGGRSATAGLLELSAVDTESRGAGGAECDRAASADSRR